MKQFQTAFVFLLKESQLQNKIRFNIHNHAVASIVIEPCLIASYNPESKSHCRCGPTLSCWRSVPTRSSSHEVTSSSRLYSLSSLSDCVDGSRYGASTSAALI